MTRGPGLVVPWNYLTHLPPDVAVVLAFLVQKWAGVSYGRDLTEKEEEEESRKGVYGWVRLTKMIVEDYLEGMEYPHFQAILKQLDKENFIVLDRIEGKRYYRLNEKRFHEFGISV